MRDIPLVLDACFLTHVCVSQTHDDVAHPADITLTWAECVAAFCDYEEMSTEVTVTCAGDMLLRSLVHCVIKTTVNC